jgi:hypothetical protein
MPHPCAESAEAGAVADSTTSIHLLFSSHWLFVVRLPHSTVQKVEKRVQPLADLRELIMSDSIESFELNYTTLLQNHPDCPVSLPPSKLAFDKRLTAHCEGACKQNFFFVTCKASFWYQIACLSVC